VAAVPVSIPRLRKRLDGLELQTDCSLNMYNYLTGKQAIKTDPTL
jgi:hypothetical protein